jgi:predicted Rossmann-fold nucleotide-binding protein
MWPGLIDWMRATMVERGLVSPPDFDVIKVVGSSDEAIPIIRESYERWFQQEKADAHPGTGS